VQVLGDQGEGGTEGLVELCYMSGITDESRHGHPAVWRNGSVWSSYSQESESSRLRLQVRVLPSSTITFAACMC
jgi:hypothetical protein